MDRQGLSYISNFRNEVFCMKKFIWKLTLASLPFIIYLTIFIIYEPYNYWGIKDSKSGRWATPLARVREFQRNPAENLILGDSRMNHFDFDYVEEIEGERFANLSTGGQALNLSRELYEWAKSQIAVRDVVIDASFYQIREGNDSPSAQAVFAIAEQPLAYITTRDYVVEAFELFITDIEDFFARGNMEQTSESSIAQNDSKYREDLVIYATDSILPCCKKYSIGEEQMRDIIFIADDVRENGGEPLIICPPVQESIWDYVIFPLELEDELETYKSELEEHSMIYDMEWISDFARNQDIYADGFHFLRGDGYQQFENAVLTGEADFIHVRAYQPKKTKNEEKE